MQSGFIAALVATLTLGFVECLARFYPSRATWRRLRRVNGRVAMMKMRERFEISASRRTARLMVMALLVLLAAWVAGASLLDKRWHEVFLDVVPYLIVGAALLRVPSALRAIAERMRVYEHEVGDDSPEDDDGWPPGDVASL